MAVRRARAYKSPMSDSEVPLRDQLDEAIARVRRELEIIRSPSTIGGGADNRSAIRDLEAELEELRAARAGVGPHDV